MFPCNCQTSSAGHWAILDIFRPYGQWCIEEQEYFFPLKAAVEINGWIEMLV